MNPITKMHELFTAHNDGMISREIRRTRAAKYRAALTASNVDNESVCAVFKSMSDQDIVNLCETDFGSTGAGDEWAATKDVYDSKVRGFRDRVLGAA